MGPLEPTVGKRRAQALATVTIATTVLLLGFGAGQAKAASTLVAGCPGVTTSTLNIPSGGLRFAQSFTSTVTENLSRGEMEITKPPASSGDWTMEIFAVSGGIPTGAPLASTTIADSNVLTGDSRIVGEFSPGFTLQSGVTYALSITRATTWGIRDHSDSCPGQEFESTSASGPWANNGAYSGGSFDFPFAIYAAPPPPAASTPGASTLAASTPATTGLRAAALRNCKKRAQKHGWSKDRLKKCKKKARTLPV
jgi:hypothetical protein